MRPTLPESRPGHRRPDHNLRAGAGRRLHDPLHEPGREHPLQETDEEAAEPLLLPLAPLSGRLDLLGDGLPRRFRPPLHIS